MEKTQEVWTYLSLKDIVEHNRLGCIDDQRAWCDEARKCMWVIIASRTEANYHNCRKVRITRIAEVIKKAKPTNLAIEEAK